MAKLGDIATMQVAGRPVVGDDDTLHDAWLIWVRIRNSVTDRNRKAGDGQPLPCKPMTLDGVPGWVWQGHISDARRFVFPPGQPREHPYTPATSDPDDIQRAKNNFSTVHSRLTKSTANLVNVETHRPDPSIWWVRDEFSGVSLPEGRYRVLLAMARGEEIPDQPEPAAPAQPAPEVPAAGASPPESAATVYICRYRDAAGCAYTTTVQGSLYSHAEAGTVHTRHEIPLQICPVCGDGFDSPLGRALHLSKAHNVAKDSVQRNLLDLEQTTKLWAKREDKAARTAAAGGMSPGTTRDMADPDIEAAIDAFTPRKPEPAVQAPATPGPAPLSDFAGPGQMALIGQSPPEFALLPPEPQQPAGIGNPAVEAVRQLVSDYDKAVAERNAAVTELQALRKQQAQLANIKAALQLAQEALDDEGA